jgi:hypothetical protein
MESDLEGNDMTKRSPTLRIYPSARKSDTCLSYYRNDSQQCLVGQMIRSERIATRLNFFDCRVTYRKYHNDTFKYTTAPFCVSSSVGIATGVGRPGFESQQRQEMFIHSTASGPSLGPTQRLSNGYRGGGGVAYWPGREADHSLPSNAEVKNGGVMIPPPHTSSWRGA